MSFQADTIRSGIVLLGGIQREEFIAASGAKANRKVELNVLNTKGGRLLRGLITRALADLARPYEPDLIIPIPKGANKIASETASRLDIGCAFLKWIDKTPGSKQLDYESSEDMDKVTTANRVILIDDVFSTGSSMRTAHQMPVISEKIQAGLVVWDRSDRGMEDMPFDMQSVVSRHIPFWVEE